MIISKNIVQDIGMGMATESDTDTDIGTDMDTLRTLSYKKFLKIEFQGLMPHLVLK